MLLGASCCGMLRLLLLVVVHWVRLMRRLLAHGSGVLAHMLSKLCLWRAACHLIVRHLPLGLAHVLSWLGWLLLLLVLGHHLLGHLLDLIDVLEVGAGCALTLVADQERDMRLDHALRSSHIRRLLVARVLDLLLVLIDVILVVD